MGVAARLDGRSRIVEGLVPCVRGSLAVWTGRALEGGLG